MYILSIESSCDETSAAIVDMAPGHRRILSNKIASQIDIHRLYGGVVPEIASRAHTEAISRLTYEALNEANLGMAEIDAIGVTAFPGLIGALLVGVNFAKSLAYAQGKPLVPVNHIRGHVAANYLCHPELEPPVLALIVSGGHPSLVRVRGYTDYEVIGHTRDDAAGEAFDKVARVMGMPYPGGAEMDRLAMMGNPHAIHFPSAAVRKSHPDEICLDFSFSGLKTAVINHIHTIQQRGEDLCREDVAASFTKTVVDSILQRLNEALDYTELPSLVLAGGVAANSHLRAAAETLAKQRGIALYLPAKPLCGDNGAMIGAQAYYEYLAGSLAGEDLNARASDE